MMRPAIGGTRRVDNAESDAIENDLLARRSGSNIGDECASSVSSSRKLLVFDLERCRSQNARRLGLNLNHSRGARLSVRSDDNRHDAARPDAGWKLYVHLGRD